MGDTVPGPFDILKDWFNLPNMTGKERAEAKARLEEWLRNKAKLRRTRPK